MSEDERRDDYRKKPWRIEIWGVAFLLFAVTGLGIWQLAEVVDSIQVNREEIVRENCEDQNARHDSSIAALDEVLSRAVKENPERREQIEQSRTATVLLIDALVPVQDCEERVEILNTE